MVALARTARRQEPALADTEFARDAIAGLGARPKRLSPKYFYDARGSQLFEEITRLPEYYPTRHELAILERCANEIADLVADGAALVEFGSGSTRKARIVLGAAPGIEAYVPVDISADMLRQEAADLRRDLPLLQVLPVPADFTKPFHLPREVTNRPRVGFFPGSTIGNFEPHAAAAFLAHAADMLGSGATLIVGFDLVKDAAVLHAAYNDAAGVTARFNLNLLERMNRELAATFDIDGFRHQAFFNSERSRIEMHLASRRPQRVRVAGRWFDFIECETIHTENSYKYTPDTFRTLARGAGWTPLADWSDGWFAVQALAANGR